ncbi:MAG: PIG-L family deacetylase [Planctomycetes bacterium]|nr:PIG-L family deacetylase [Planctomycetota bacterium]
MSKAVFAIAAHPDDIELMMGGTFLLLARAGYEPHYMTLANGSCGSAEHGPAETAAIRARESREAAKALGAAYHEPLVDDLMIYYTPELAARLCAIVRRINPEIMLLPSPQDYMEDHTNTSRLAVTAAFCRGMPNFAAIPPTQAVAGEVALYHAMPWGLRDQLCNEIRPDFVVDVSSVIEQKRQALACHRSQKQWLDKSQGVDSYLAAMMEMAAKVGKKYGPFKYAEGWRRHLPLGFCAENFDPLTIALGGLVKNSRKGRKSNG